MGQEPTSVTPLFQSRPCVSRKGRRVSDLIAPTPDPPDRTLLVGGVEGFRSRGRAPSSQSNPSETSPDSSGSRNDPGEESREKTLPPELRQMSHLTQDRVRPSSPPRPPLSGSPRRTTSDSVTGHVVTLPTVRTDPHEGWGPSSPSQRDRLFQIELRTAYSFLRTYLPAPFRTSLSLVVYVCRASYVLRLNL